MHAVSVITSIIVTTVHVSSFRVSSFCERTLESLDSAPDLLQEKNSTNQRARYIYKLHKFETHLYPFIHIKTIKKHFPGVKFSLLILFLIMPRFVRKS